MSNKLAEQYNKVDRVVALTTASLRTSEVVPWQTIDPAVRPRAVRLAEKLLAPNNITDYKQWAPGTGGVLDPALVKRLTDRQLLELSELYGSEFGKTVLKDKQVLISRGHAGKVTVEGVVGGTEKVTHTQPGKMQVVPSLEDFVAAEGLGARMRVVARGNTPNEVVALDFNLREVKQLKALLEQSENVVATSAARQTARLEFLDAIFAKAAKKQYTLPDAFCVERDLLRGTLSGR